MRKLATIRKIDELLPIEGADLVMIAKIDGWQCVVKASEFKVGDPCLYFEIDSLIPMSPAVEFLRARSFKKMGDKGGIRIKTIKLRGQLSQGLALPLNSFPKVGIECQKIPNEYSPSAVFTHLCNLDWTEILGVEKYEPPIPPDQVGKLRGNFPVFIKKTYQERCQNLVRDIFIHNIDAGYEVTMKLDGMSFTSFYMNGIEGVCSRIWELELAETNEHNKMVRMYIDSGLQAALRKLGLNYAVQGELMGPGIIKNREGLAHTTLFIFDIYDIDNECYLTPKNRHNVLSDLYAHGLNKDMVKHVPVLILNGTLAQMGITKISELLAYADGPSLAHLIREGLVFKSIDGGFSFKAISNHFLLKSSD